MAPPNLATYAFVLGVPDLKASVAYFEDVLGFARDWNDGDDWQALTRGGVRLMLGHCPDALPPTQLGDHSYFAYVDVDDLDAFHAEIASKGAIVRSAPADKPWGRREMAVATPDGHRMMFGQYL